jgi:ATP-binding cassette subfamily F protein 3
MSSPTALIQSALGNSLDYPVLSYINSLFTASDADPSDDPVNTFIRPLLQSESSTPVEPTEIDRICLEFTRIWEKLTGAELAAKAKGESNGGPAKLDQALDMRRQELKSKRGAVTQVVDIASVVSLCSH